jgi:hypothetical protein
MTRRPLIEKRYRDDEIDNNYTCPHCGTLQVTAVAFQGFNAFLVRGKQCRACRDVQIEYAWGGSSDAPWIAVYPGSRPWRGRVFTYAPPEALTAYNDACHLYSVHTGAAGAYARRALELLLDNAGYAAPSLDAAIKSAKAERDVDRRLPKRLLQKLDYIREIGNFALHTRRDDGLVIVEISDEEVAACVETIEELIDFIYEEPANDYLKTISINEKLVRAGKKPIGLPSLPNGVSLEAGQSADEES